MEASDEEFEEAEATDLQEIRVALKPRCNLLASVKEFRNNHKIGSVELDMYKNWLKEAIDEEVYALFDALGQSPSLRKLTIQSKGSANQSLPVSYLTHCLNESSGLQELRLMHVKWKGDKTEFDDLAASIGDNHTLRVWHLHVESMDTFESVIASAGHVQTLQEIEIQTAQAASDKAGLTNALQSLCTSKSLLSLKLAHVTTKFEVLSPVARLLSANETLRELCITANELDLNGGMTMAQMLTANNGLHTFILKLDKMHSEKLGEEFIRALEMNGCLKYFQIILDGRMSDMKVVRSMQIQFRDTLRPKYKVSTQVGLSMGVICERA
jgi:hypothetical protein